MFERLVVLSFKCVNPDEAAALAALDQYMNVPCDLTIVYVCANVDTDDAGADVDINDDGVAAISAIDIADKEDPGEWISTAMGGAETPVFVAAGSELSIDVNDAAAQTTVQVHIWALTGSAVA